MRRFAGASHFHPRGTPKGQWSVQPMWGDEPPRKMEPHADLPGRLTYQLDILSLKRNTAAGGELGVILLERLEMHSV